MPSFIQKDPSSFRDPSGFVFQKDYLVYRQVNKDFKDHFDFFISSGCYKKLADADLLIPHQEIKENFTGDSNWYTTLLPEQIRFISYPYEWSFDMLKDAALLTLSIAQKSIASGMILKDATPFNIQWHNGKLVFIDSLSFERYNEELPWIAYRQFCECFLSPLLLMHHTKISLHSLLLAYPEGIPLAVTQSLLPWKSKFSFHTYLHVHLQASYAGKSAKANQKVSFSKKKMLNLLLSLETLIKKLKSPSKPTTWSAYYEEASQRNDYVERKKELISSWVSELSDIKDAIDTGANDGIFSEVLAAKNIFAIAADADPLCINNLYKNIKALEKQNILPLIIDFSNPSPAIGLNNTERKTFQERVNTDMVFALAIIHHLVIGKNIPFASIANQFCKYTKKYLIIEFVPKADEKIQQMLKDKPDIYTNYSAEKFEKEFCVFFNIVKKQEIGSSGRVLYLMAKDE
ncbi:MAG: hypothetical protein ABIP79_05430 [Chitinophagaceae bacterium]